MYYKMKSFINKLLFGALLILVGSAFVSCDDSIDENETQRDFILSYLTGSHDPILIAESAVSSSLDFEPAFYTPYGKYAYRYIEDYYNSSRDDESVVKKGSNITLTFKLYGFSGTAIDSTTLPTYSNDASLEADYVAAGLNTTLWDFTPLAITVGESSKILSSVQTGLIGCRNGDTVELYLTRDEGYGGEVVGLITDSEALLFICTIESVE